MLKGLGGKLILGVWAVCMATLAMALLHPRSPVPDEWHLLRPLSISDPVTPLTDWKLRRALQDGVMCRQILSQRADFTPQEALEDGPGCHIRDRLDLRAVAGAALDPLDTRCQIALRLAMWTEHGIRPAALRHLGEDVARIHHASSYSCRQIRTPGGDGGRMSTHATADAVDIRGVTLANGRRLSLLDGWNGPPEEQAFFRDIRDSACLWFRVTLGPDYNRLHADHFHLQHTGWGLCR